MPFSSVENIGLEPGLLGANAPAPVINGSVAKQLGRISNAALTVRRKLSPRTSRKTVQKAVAELSAMLLMETLDWDGFCTLLLGHCVALSGGERGYAMVMNGRNCNEFYLLDPNRRVQKQTCQDGSAFWPWGIEYEILKPTYKNVFSKHPLWEGPTDAPIRNFLSLPAIFGGASIGVIAIANAKKGFRQSNITTIRPLVELYAMAIQRRRAHEELGRKSRELQQRINYLNCIFKVSEACERKSPLESSCARIVEVIRAALAVPEFTTVVLDLDGQSYMTGTPARPVYIMSSKLVVSGLKRGRIKVFYHGPAERQPEFSAGEQRLLDEVARRFTRNLERMELAEQLQRAHDNLGRKVQERTAELNLANKYLMAMGNLNRCMASAGDEVGLCEYACDLMVNICGHGSAWVGVRGEDDNMISVVSSSGIDLSAAKAMIEGDACQDDQCLRFPLWLKNGTLNGVLALCTSDSTAFGETERSLIEDFADELSIGLSSIWTRAEHRRAQQELLSQTISLEEARKMEVFGRLAGSVAHEVRNPLNAIMGITEALDRRLGGAAEYKPFISHMSEQVERLSKLMKDLLDLGRPVDETRMQVHPVIELCGSAFILWRRGAGGNASFEIAAGDRDINALCDAGKIGQVLINLLDNAVQNGSDDKDIKLTISRTPDDMAMVRISDKGRGMSEETRPRVFEPFFTSRRGGMGLGLSIVKHIIDLHHGTVSIYNNHDGAGCTVEFSLPLVR